MLEQDQTPVWKNIGEASNDFVMYIEQVNGNRVPVRRFGAMQQFDIDVMEIENRVQRDIVREAMRPSFNPYGLF